MPHLLPPCCQHNAAWDKFYADMRGEFKSGKVTIAAASFQQCHRRGSEGWLVGHLTLWIEEQKLPPLE